MFARTERLLLRPGWPEDAPALAQALGDDDDLAGTPWAEARDDAGRWLARPQSGSLPCLLVFARGPGAARLAGGIALTRDSDGEAALHCWIAREYRGIGVATEAGRAIIDIARDALRLPRLVAGHALHDPAGGRVLRRLGFRPTGRTTERHDPGRGGPVRCACYALDFAQPAALAA